MWTPSKVAEAAAIGAGVQARPFILGTGQRGGLYQHPSKNRQRYLRENSVWLLTQNANVQVPVTSCYFITAHSVWRSLPFLLVSQPSPIREAVRRQGWGEVPQTVSTVCSVHSRKPGYKAPLQFLPPPTAMIPLTTTLPTTSTTSSKQLRGKGLTCLGKDMTTDLGQGCV